MVNLQRSGANLLFSFTTLAGRPHRIEGNTNLHTGTWIQVSNFIGDGSLKQFSFPTTNPPIRFFRVKTR